MFGDPSVSRISYVAVPSWLKYLTSRHSITNTRFGGVPIVAVKMPPPSLVSWSSQCGAIVWPNVAVGRHSLK
jgi:hypothetical protein